MHEEIFESIIQKNCSEQPCSEKKEEEANTIQMNVETQNIYAIITYVFLINELSKYSLLGWTIIGLIFFLPYYKKILVKFIKRKLKWIS